jgi:ankyrin repeat protein
MALIRRGADLWNPSAQRSILNQAAYARTLFETLVNTLAEQESWVTKIDNTDCYRRTLLHWAVNDRMEMVVRLLISNNANLDAVDSEGHTPLHLAVLRGQLKICYLLVIAGADVAITSSDGETALELAERIRGGRAISGFLSSAQDPSVRRYDGGNPEIVEIYETAYCTAKAVEEAEQKMNKYEKGKL